MPRYYENATKTPESAAATPSWAALLAVATAAAAGGALAAVLVTGDLEKRRRAAKFASAAALATSKRADGHAGDNAPEAAAAYDGVVTKSSPLPQLPESEVELLDEQLSRGRVFLGDEGQKRLEDSFVIVVGAGGVGSHCAHFLARSGVRRLRLIDFDNVTLSSLNRHAVADRSDVGKPKVQALKRHIAAFMPYCAVEVRNEMFIGDQAQQLLEGEPDYVVDCIDDSDTKTDLLAYCVEHKIPVISSMAAGARTDPTRLHFCSLGDVVRDPIASKLRFLLRKKFLESPNADASLFDEASAHIEVLYSSELTRVNLLPLDNEVADAAPEDLGAVANFRVRIMPVLGPMPAIFGMSMASRVLTNLAGQAFEPLSAPRMKQRGAQKLYAKFRSNLAKLKQAMADAAPEDEASDAAWKSWNLDDIGEEDIEVMASHFGMRCPVTGTKPGDGTKYQLAIWRYDRPLAPHNLVIAAPTGYDKLASLLVARRLPTPTSLGLDKIEYDATVCIASGIRDPATRRKEAASEEAFKKVCVRACGHMNKDHAKDNLTLVQRHAGLKPISVEMVSMDRLKMTFVCAMPSGQSQHVDIYYPSILIEPAEIRETIVKMTLQARKDGEEEEEEEQPGSSAPQQPAEDRTPAREERSQESAPKAP